ncbi:hypothetical protein [Sporosarcina koreensis]|uniref:hypothetical protein n=1 Tax=Sporosarcina koreensis TaxID=334735 RepID=UPI00075AB5C4|nr:hypothetical protein [Sporosarcina koreensis]
MTKTIMILEVSNASDEQIQTGLGKAFADFCKEYNGAGITASVLTDRAGEQVVKYINEEAI